MADNAAPGGCISALAGSRGTIPTGIVLSLWKGSEMTLKTVRIANETREGILRGNCYQNMERIHRTKHRPTSFATDGTSRAKLGSNDHNPVGEPI